MHGLVDECQFRLSVDDIVEFLCVSNRGDATYFENLTLDVLFQKYILEAKLSESVLESKVRYKNPVNATNLTPIAFTFWHIMVANVLP